MKIVDNWKRFPELEHWIRDLEAWVGEFGISDFVAADDQGFDLTGRIAATDPKLVWTAETAGDYQTISASLGQGNSPIGGVTGWYIGSKPHAGELVYEDLKTIYCEHCDSDGCEDCDFEGSFWAYFEDTPAYPRKFQTR